MWWLVMVSFSLFFFLSSYSFFLLLLGCGGVFLEVSFFLAAFLSLSSFTMHDRDTNLMILLLIPCCLRWIVFGSWAIEDMDGVSYLER